MNKYNMKPRIYVTIGLIIMVLGMVAILFIIINSNQQGSFETKSIDCFDSHNYKIIGVSCEEKVYESDFELTYFLLFWMLWILVGEVIFAIGVVVAINKGEKI